MPPTKLSRRTELEAQVNGGAAILQDHKQQVAAIFGVTGLVGRELAKKLTSNPTWHVYGIARNPAATSSPIIQTNNYHFISCDISDPSDIRTKLPLLSDVTHVFWVTWSPRFPIDSRGCYEQNKSMLADVMDTVLAASKGRLKHVSIQTGTKHYVSIEDDVVCRGKEVVYYNEECPRVGPPWNFYYGLEDVLKEKLAAAKVAWSVQRPGLITGSSHRTWYNFMGTVGVYGSICKHLNLPFVFGGTRACWEETYLDVSDARLVAEQHIWASTNERVASAEGQAFNAINGGGDYTWRQVWAAIGRKFGIEMEEEEEMLEEEYWYSKAMSDKGGIWREIAEKKGLACTDVESLANWGFLDMLFRCPVKMLCSRDKVDRLGRFGCSFEAQESVLYWIDVMRDEKLIP